MSQIDTGTTISYRDYLDAHALQGGTLILEITHFCPVGCAHCHIASGPTARLHLNEEQIHSSITSFSRYPDARYVFCTGGEPFSELSLLRTALTAIRSSQMRSYTLTSGSWATSLAQAGRVLDSLGAIDLFGASIDSYHLAKLSIEQPLNAVEAACQRGSTSFITVGHLGTHDPVRTHIVKSIHDRFGASIPILYYPLLARGAGANLVELGGRELERPSLAPCFSVGAPLVTANGQIVACCQSSQANTIRGGGSTPLHLGDCNDFDAAMKSYIGNPFIAAMRTLGPAQTAEALKLDVPKDFPAWDICRACEHLQDRLPPQRLIEELSRNTVLSSRVTLLDEILSRGSAQRLLECVQ